MSDSYEDLVRARAANVALQHLVNEHRKALLALVAQPFSPACIAQAKAVASTKIDTALAEQHFEEFMEMWRQMNGDDGPRDTLFDSFGAVR